MAGNAILQKGAKQWAEERKAHNQTKPSPIRGVDHKERSVNKLGRESQQNKQIVRKKMKRKERKNQKEGIKNGERRTAGIH